jgi:hypothetical protein
MKLFNMQFHQAGSRNYNAPTFQKEMFGSNIDWTPEILTG